MIKQINLCKLNRQCYLYAYSSLNGFIREACITKSFGCGFLGHLWIGGSISSKGLQGEGEREREREKGGGGGGGRW